jgi:hypothetical protein
MDHLTTDTAGHDSRHLIRRAFLLAAIPAVLLAARMAESAEVTLQQENGESWTIEINPRQTAAASTQVALETSPVFPQANVPPAPPEPFPMNDVSLVQADGQDAEPALPQAEIVVEEEPAEEHGIAIVPNRKLRLSGLSYRQVYDSIPYSRTEYLANPAYRHEATMELLTGIPRQKVVHSNYEPKLNTPIEPQPQFLYNPYGMFGPGFGHGYGWGGGFYGLTYPPAFRYFMPLDFGL